MNNRKVFLSGFVLAALLAGTRLAFLFAPVSTDPDEGWNAVHAVLAMGGGALYPPAGELTGTNYPPLSFFLVGLLGKMTGDMIFAGRLLALLGIVCVAVLVWRLSLKLTRNRLASAGALLLFALYNTTLCRSYFGMDDPQWLGQAFALAGLAVLMPRAPRATSSGWRVILAACLVVAGGFVKQNLVGIPLAATVWLAMENRGAFGIWLAAAGGALALGFGLCVDVYGPPFFHNVFFLHRNYQVSRAVLKSLPILLALLPMLWASLWLARFWREDTRLRLLLLCALTALVTGIVERGGSGVDINAHFESLCVLCILSGLALARARGAWRWFMVPFIVLVPLGAVQGWREVVSYPARLAAFEGMEAHIRAQPAPVACEDLAYCYWAGKGYPLDFFLYGQNFLATHKDRALRVALADGEIGAAQIDMPSGPRSAPSDPLPPRLQSWSTGTLYRSGGQILIALPR
ncbi:hypothetical protein [Acidocella sp.]|uniref:hypothetical protein n=1 Tax=Acidocella sp. TaxID=50710 RepID=UPI002617D03B|nr:hypothetical protein [Acidocella sp.]